jgi:hypothetical protein
LRPQDARRLRPRARGLQPLASMPWLTLLASMPWLTLLASMPWLTLLASMPWLTLLASTPDFSLHMPYAKYLLFILAKMAIIEAEQTRKKEMT